MYGPDKVEAALGNYFRVGNLTALRELALLWVADKVDDQLDRYRADHGIGSHWEARERVVVALTGGPEGDTLIRRAARIAARTKGADLLAVHVARSDGLTGGDPAHLARQRVLLEDLGGTYHEVLGSDITDSPAGLCTRRQRHPTRSRSQPPRPLGPTVLAGRRGQHHRPIGIDRRAPGHPRKCAPLAVPKDGDRPWRVGSAAVSARPPHRRLHPRPARPAVAHRCSCSAVDAGVSLPTDILVFLALVVAVAFVGGLWPALLAAVAGSCC